MGLDTSHDCWHGPYSSFNQWRNDVAKAAGYELERVTEDGFTHDRVVIGWERIARENPGCFQGEWAEPQSDALIFLIAHSDCDGVLHPEQARPLADRLESLLPHLPDDGLPWSTRRQTERFIAGLREAVEAGEDVDFH